ncbi:ATP-dependent RNA helicase SUV3, mitochondrial [Cyberlindnera fabianii]|uniref:ATP-dependent RNA helicase SUV3, mitochondrial n=1 Tax=Cyberlindnera fabianii TaxID=36022 RepID=A0A1V2L218_CYBFA|nr:ATP-dependent RNA helicase SUV3, mitochondrial [Cyberlindnera fabianii]
MLRSPVLRLVRKPLPTLVRTRVRVSAKSKSSKRPKKESQSQNLVDYLPNTRSNDWISGFDTVTSTHYDTLGKLSSHSGPLKTIEGLQDIIEVALFELTESIYKSDFKHIKSPETDKKHMKFTLQQLEHDITNSLSSESSLQPVTLSHLLLPTPQTLPSTLYALLHPTPLITTFFKDIANKPEDQAYYLLEHAFKNQLTSISAHLTSPQDLRVDISNPAEWYPSARRLKRHLILHVGPTNSGKTYNALKRLRESNDGVYAGPLRLLAREVYNRFKSDGIRCNLITGEEVIHDLDEFGSKAPLSCSTVEMVSLNTDFEVAVIDEIQMIADEQRGSAWTNALLGVKAKEVHLCGEASVVPLIRRLAEITGDKVTVNEYERLGTLKVEKKPLMKSFDDLRKGDCVVVFSKKRILAYKAEIERTSRLKVGVIYGALPAETRTEQANKFNSGEYDVLVASDAIGMGLNLRIRRVIFDDHKKYNGNRKIDIPIPHIKQIGGRAGRFKVAPSGNTSTGAEPRNTEKDDEDDEAVGYVSAFTQDSLDYIRQCMAADTIMLKKATLWPSDEILSQYISEFPNNTPIQSIIRKFKSEVQRSSLFAIGSDSDILSMLEVLEHVRGMLMADLLRITTAPLSPRLPQFNSVLFEFAASVTNNQTLTCFDFKSLDFSVLEKKLLTIDDLSLMENLHKYLMVWLWMNNRYPSLFVNRESAIDVKNLIEDKIEDVLSGMNMKKLGGKAK